MATGFDSVDCCYAHGVNEAVASFEFAECMIIGPLKRLEKPVL